jgi:hypothetical protein
VFGPLTEPDCPGATLPGATRVGGFALFAWHEALQLGAGRPHLARLVLLDPASIKQPVAMARTNFVVLWASNINSSFGGGEAGWKFLLTGN